MNDVFTAGEIANQYRLAKNRKHTIRILMQLADLKIEELIKILDRYGIPSADAKKMLKDQKRASIGFDREIWEKAIRMKLQNIPNQTIYDETGISSGRLKDWRTRAAAYGIDISVKPPKRDKMTKENWEEIIHLRLLGYSNAAVSEMTGKKAATVRNWRQKAVKYGIPLPDERGK